MLMRRLDLPLGKDVTVRSLFWIIGAVVFVTVLAGAANAMLGQLGERWETGLAGNLTVQINPAPPPPPPPAATATAAPDERPPGTGVPTAAPPAQSPEDPDAVLADAIARTLAFLRAEPGVAGAALLSDDEVARLLEPWLGGSLPPELPVPALIDVTIADPAGLDLPDLARRLRTAVPEAHLETQDAWLEDLRRLGRAAQVAALSVVLVTGVALMLVVVFAVHAGLATHQPIIELLHIMGAADSYIAAQFQSHIFWLVLRSAGTGAVAGALFLQVFLAAAASRIEGLLPGLGFGGSDWLWFFGVPVAACFLAAQTARHAVLMALARLP